MKGGIKGAMSNVDQGEIVGVQAMHCRWEMYKMETWM